MFATCEIGKSVKSREIILRTPMIVLVLSEIFCGLDLAGSNVSGILGTSFARCPFLSHL